MRHSMCVAALLVIAHHAFNAPAVAQQSDYPVVVYQTVIIIKDVNVTRPGAASRKVFRGQTLIVDGIEGKKLHLVEPANGWIDKTDATTSEDVAFALFNDQVMNNPNDVGAYIARGCASSITHGDDRITQSKGKAALKDFDTAIRMDPTNPRAYANRGYCNLLLGLTDNAIADCTRAIQLGTSNPVVYQNRAEAFVAKQDLQKAIADYSHAITLDAANPARYWDRAIVFEKRGDTAKAIADAEKVIELCGAARRSVRIPAQCTVVVRNRQRQVN